VTESSFLSRMAADSRARVTAARAKEPEAALLARAMATEPPPPLALTDFDLIAELKLRSPAEGVLASARLDQDAQLLEYASGGVAAISVLTQASEFKGSMEYLENAAALMRPRGVPVMRKDFLTDPYQVLEARAAGAGGVLVIVTMLSDEAVGALLACARESGLFVLLEGFDADDLERIPGLLPTDSASPVPPVLSGVNCRNLVSLEVDFERFATLASHLPARVPAIAESGVLGPEQIRRVARLGYSGALVGSALMRSPEPRSAVRRLLAAGRAARAEDRACS